MFLVTHENLQVNERKTTLYRYKQLRESLHAKLEHIDASYRYQFPFEMGVLCDLDKQLMQEHAALAEIIRSGAPTPQESPPEPPPVQKEPSLKRLYRTVCNLCHADKFDKGLPDNIKQELTRLFILGKKAYKNGNIDELRHIYDQAVDALALSFASVPDEQYRRAVEESDEELIRALDQQIASVLLQLRELKCHPLYSVFKCHASDDIAGAKQIYRQILRMKIAELTQAVQQIQAARMRAVYRKQQQQTSTSTKAYYTVIY
jgi:hypothetical protein